MKKIFKWTGIVLGGLIVLIVLAGLALYPIGKKKLTRFYPDIPIETIDISTDAAAITHGKHVSIIWSCTQCHGADLSGMLLSKEPIMGTLPIYGEIPASNLTSGKGGVGKYYQDKDWIRSIRHGIKPNLQGIVFMNYSGMSDQDLGDLIAYLKQIPPVDKGHPAMNYGPVVPIIYAMGIYTPQDALTQNSARASSFPSPGVTAEYGSYLSATCTSCHGHMIDNAFKNWKQENFIRAFRTGDLPNGKKFGAIMTAQTFREMTDEELSALWLHYSRTKN